ncbi:MAG: methyltransferase domain-containing protein [Desulfuromonadales bacterium]|nr:methyltransferase domain-containing protein [Desulfuromonadales bacterium]
MNLENKQVSNQLEVFSADIHRHIYEVTTDWCRGQNPKTYAERHIRDIQHFNKLDILSSGLDTLDAVRCLYDYRRTAIFANDIQKYVEPGMKVLDAGTGTGILAFFAASQGAKVIALELNEATCQLAKELYEYLVNIGMLNPDLIEFVCCDAVTYTPTHEFDVLLSENLYTGMLYESQCSIISNLIKYLRISGIVMPASLESYVAIGCTNSVENLKKGCVLVLDPALPESCDYFLLTQPVLYDSIDFTQTCFEGVNKSLNFIATADGRANVLWIAGTAIMPSGTSISFSDCDYFTEPVLLPFDEEHNVLKGEQIRLDLIYSYGCKPQDINIKMSHEWD